MKIPKSHRWDVSPKEAISIQKKLSKRIILRNSFSNINKIAACDISYSKSENKTWAVVIVFTYPYLNILEVKYALRKTNYPYIPGLLTFREGPALIKVLSNLENEPDIILFDGQGIAHPRRMGLATHIGILIDRPTIGCAKSLLWGKFKKPFNRKGSYSLLKEKRETLGAVVRTRKNVKPVFVSPGFKVDLKTSIDIILKCSHKFRIPEPLRQAHITAKKLKDKSLPWNILLLKGGIR